MAQSSSSPVNPFAPPASNLDPGLSHGSGNAQLAGRWTRLGAAMLDGLLYTPLLIIGGGIGYALHSGPFTPEDFKNPTHMFGIAAGVLLAFIPLAIYQWYLQATTGQSLGKRWTDIKIVKLDGTDVDFVSAVLLRTWVPTIAGWVLAAIGLRFITNLYSLVDSLFIFGEQRRCLHDLIAGTKVIAVEPKRG